jgi:uncharacterized protein (TIGR03083 family)
MRDDDIWQLIDAQRADLADFLDGLSPEQWSARSLCEDWTVRDVAAHLTQSTTSWLRFGIEAVRFGFRFDPMMSELARRDTKSPAKITGALRAMVGVRKRPPGTRVADPLIDVLVHGQDIARPLGLTRAVPTEAAVVAAGRLWDMTFPLQPRRRFPDVELVATDADFRVGSGARMSGPIADVLLALAGREAGSAMLTRAE